MSPAMIATKNRTIKIKNKIRAISTAAAAMPVKPKIAAMIATIKKINAQRSMKRSPVRLNSFHS